MIFQLLLQGELKITVPLKKSICRTNNIQKVLMPLMEEYTKTLIGVFGVSDSIFC